MKEEEDWRVVVYRDFNVWITVPDEDETSDSKPVLPLESEPS